MAFLAAFVLILSAAFSSCQREACPGAITQTEFEQAPAFASASELSLEEAE